jgi:hypothetical protein
MKFYLFGAFVVCCLLIETFVPRKEIFPFYSWSLFSDIRTKEKFYALLLKKKNAPQADFYPLILFYKREPDLLGHTELNALLVIEKKLISSFRKNDFSSYEKYKREASEIINTSLELQLVKVKANALSFLKEGKLRKKEVLEVPHHEE